MHTGAEGPDVDAQFGSHIRIGTVFDDHLDDGDPMVDLDAMQRMSQFGAQGDPIDRVEAGRWFRWLRFGRTQRGPASPSPGQINRDIASDREEPAVNRPDGRVEARAGSPRSYEGLLDCLLSEIPVDHDAYCASEHSPFVARIGRFKPPVIGHPDSMRALGRMAHRCRLPIATSGLPIRR